MNGRGYEFTKGMDLNCLYRTIFADNKELGDIFQHICIERYAEYDNNTYSYDDFYHAVWLRLMQEKVFSNNYGCQNIYMDHDSLKKAIRILDRMFPPKNYIGKGSAY